MKLRTDKRTELPMEHHSCPQPGRVQHHPQRRCILANLEPGILVGSGSGYFGWIWIRVFRFDVDPSSLVGSGSVYFG